MAENRRKGSRLPSEQLPLLDLQAQPSEEEVAVFCRVGTFFMMRTLAARSDATTEALIKSVEQTMMAGFTSLSQSVKEVVRDLIRETVTITSLAHPIADPSPVRTPLQNGSNLGPRSIHG